MAQLLPIVLALALALLCGGRVSRIAQLRLRAVWLFFFAFGIQVVAFPFAFLPWTTGEDAAKALWLVSYGCLLVAAVLNRRIVGAQIVALGMALNLVAILSNGGRMPATPEAMAGAGLDFDVMHNSVAAASPNVALARRPLRGARVGAAHERLLRRRRRHRRRGLRARLRGNRRTPAAAPPAALRLGAAYPRRMRRGGTGLVVLVVAAIAIAAGFDALRGEGSPQPSAETAPELLPPTTSPDEPVEEEPPLAEQLGGTLYYTDESCELQAVELPGPAAVDAPNWDECRFVLSPDGRRVSGAGTGWDPRSDPLIGRVFQARDGSIQVSTNGGPEGGPFAGTAPAWTPAGTLTYFADGALRVWSSGDVVLSQRELVRSVREAMPFEDTLQAVVPRETAWLDDGRLAAILSTQVGGAPSSDLLAVYEDDRLASFSAWEQEALSDLRVSPQGNYVAARTGAGGLVILDSSGAEIETPALTGYRAIAWSPDDRWAAVATDAGVLVFQPGAPGPPELELDLDANDLDWRGGLDQAPVARQSAGEAAAWLAAAGMGGRVFVTQTSDAGCRLRAVEIPSLAWAETPAGRESPCRFAVDDGGIVVQESDVPQIGGGELGTCGDLEDCAFAWAPGGRATYVAGGELFLGRPEGRSELLVLRRRSRANLRPAERPRGGGLGGRRSLLGGRSHGRHGDGRAHDRGRAGGLSVVRRAVGKRAPRQLHRHGCRELGPTESCSSTAAAAARSPSRTGATSPGRPARSSRRCRRRAR